MENEKKSCWYVSECVRIRSPGQKQETRGWESLTKTRSAKRTSAAEQKREQRTHAAPKNSSSLLSSCPPHQLTQLQQTSPMLSNVCKYRQYWPYNIVRKNKKSIKAFTIWSAERSSMTGSWKLEAENFLYMGASHGLDGAVWAAKNGNVRK